MDADKQPGEYKETGWHYNILLPVSDKQWKAQWQNFFPFFLKLLLPLSAPILPWCLSEINQPVNNPWAALAAKDGSLVKDKWLKFTK